MSFHAPVARFATLVLIAAPLAAQQAFSSADEPFGRIARPDTSLRVFPTEISPSYEETLGEGDVVRILGAADNGFVPVRLPLGVRGYVHKDFSSVDENGVLTSKVARLAFRYRPNSGEAPVEFVGEQAQFLVVEEQDDWWVVRYPERPAYVPVDAVTSFAPDAPAETLQAAWDDLEARQTAAVGAFAEARRAAAAEAAAEAARIDALAGLREAFVTETRKPNELQELGPIAEQVVAIRDAAGEDDPSRVEAEALLEDVTYQQKLIAAKLLLEEEPVRAEPIVPAAAVRDPMRDFVTGWLRATGGMFGAPRGWELTKGGQVLFTVECSSGRYDLRMYEGFEVALNGRADRPDPESLRTLDVDRMRVLGRSR